MTLTFGPNGIEYTSSFDTFNITNGSSDTIEITGSSNDKKRFKLSLSGPFSSTVTKTINNTKINADDIIAFTILSDHNNLDIKIYNVSNGSCKIDFIPNGTSTSNANIMFLILT